MQPCRSLFRDGCLHVQFDSQYLGVFACFSHCSCGISLIEQTYKLKAAFHLDDHRAWIGIAII